MKRIISHSYRDDMLLKEYGYHGFNVVVHSQYLDWIKPKLRKRLINEELFQKILINSSSKYGGGYNPVGIELAVAQGAIGEFEKSIAKLNHHFDVHFDRDQFCMMLDTDDSICLTSRLYEMYYLSTHLKENMRFINYKWILA